MTILQIALASQSSLNESALGIYNIYIYIYKGRKQCLQLKGSNLVLLLWIIFYCACVWMCVEYSVYSLQVALAVTSDQSQVDTAPSRDDTTPPLPPLPQL